MANVDDQLGLWVSDGTAEGTQAESDDAREQTLISALAQAGDGSHLFGMVNSGGTVYYYHTDQNQREPRLWRSDGSAAGARMVADTAIASTESLMWLRPALPARLGANLLFFAALDEVHGQELWVSMARPQARRW